MSTYKTLLSIYQSRPDLQKEFPDVTQKGTSGNWTINDWWNQYGVKEMPDVALVQPGDPRLQNAPGTPMQRFVQKQVASGATPAAPAPAAPAPAAPVTPTVDYSQQVKDIYQQNFGRQPTQIELDDQQKALGEGRLTIGSLTDWAQTNPQNIKTTGAVSQPQAFQGAPLPTGETKPEGTTPTGDTTTKPVDTTKPTDTTDITAQFKKYTETLAANQAESQKKTEDLLKKMGEDTTSATLTQFQEMQKGLQASYNTYFQEQTKYLDELKNQPSAVANLQKFREQQGLPQMEAQLAGVDKTILDTEGLLANIEADIRKRTEGLPVSEAAARRLTAMEQKPLTKQMDELLRSRQRVAAGLQAKQANVEEFMSAQREDLTKQQGIAEAKLGISKEQFGFKKDIATQGFEMFTTLQDRISKIDELRITQTGKEADYKNELAKAGFDFFSQLRAEQAAATKTNTTFQNELTKIKLENDLKKANPNLDVKVVEGDDGNVTVVTTNPQTGKSEITNAGKIGKTKEATTSDITEYEYAVKNNAYKGTLQQWQREQENLKAKPTTEQKPLTTSPQTIKNWILKNKQANPDVPYYDLWGQLSDELTKQGLNPSNYDKEFWEILHPEGLAGYAEKTKGKGATNEADLQKVIEELNTPLWKKIF